MVQLYNETIENVNPFDKELQYEAKLSEMVLECRRLAIQDHDYQELEKIDDWEKEQLKRIAELKILSNEWNEKIAVVTEKKYREESLATYNPNEKIPFIDEDVAGDQNNLLDEAAGQNNLLDEAAGQNNLLDEAAGDVADYRNNLLDEIAAADQNKLRFVYEDFTESKNDLSKQKRKSVEINAYNILDDDSNVYADLRNMNRKFEIDAAVNKKIQSIENSSTKKKFQSNENSSIKKKFQLKDSLFNDSIWEQMAQESNDLISFDQKIMNDMSDDNVEESNEAKKYIPSKPIRRSFTIKRNELKPKNLDKDKQSIISKNLDESQQSKVVTVKGNNLFPIWNQMTQDDSPPPKMLRFVLESSNGELYEDAAGEANYYKALTELYDLQDKVDESINSSNSFEELYDLKEKSFDELYDLKEKSFDELYDLKEKSFDELYDLKEKSFDELYDLKEKSFDELYDSQEKSFDVLYDSREKSFDVKAFDELYDSQEKAVDVKSFDEINFYNKPKVTKQYYEYDKLKNLSIDNSFNKGLLRASKIYQHNIETDLKSSKDEIDLEKERIKDEIDLEKERIKDTNSKFQSVEDNSYWYRTYLGPPADTEKDMVEVTIPKKVKKFKKYKIILAKIMSSIFD